MTTLNASPLLKIGGFFLVGLIGGIAIARGLHIDSRPITDDGAPRVDASDCALLASSPLERPASSLTLSIHRIPREAIDACQQATQEEPEVAAHWYHLHRAHLAETLRSKSPEATANGKQALRRAAELGHIPSRVDALLLRDDQFKQREQSLVPMQALDRELSSLETATPPELYAVAQIKMAIYQLRGGYGSGVSRPLAPLLQSVAERAGYVAFYIAGTEDRDITCDLYGLLCHWSIDVFERGTDAEAFLLAGADRVAYARQESQKLFAQFSGDEDKRMLAYGQASDLANDVERYAEFAKHYGNAQQKESANTLLIARDRYREYLNAQLNNAREQSSRIWMAIGAALLYSVMTADGNASNEQIAIMDRQSKEMAENARRINCNDANLRAVFDDGTSAGTIGFVRGLNNC